MAPPRKNVTADQELRQTRQQPQVQQEGHYNNIDEVHANANGPPSSHANEFIVVDLVTQTAQMDNNNNVNDNNSTNLVNEIRSLAATVAADSRAANNVDDVLILRYDHNDIIANSVNNNNSIVNNEVFPFSGIHIRNNNSVRRNCVDSIVPRQIHGRMPPESISDNAHSGIFHTSASAINSSNLIVCQNESPVVVSNVIQHNPVAAVNRADDSEREVADEDETGAGAGGDGNGRQDGAESARVLFEPQHELVTTPPTIELSGSTTSAFIPIVAANVDEFIAHDYLQHNSRSRRRRRRQGRGRRRRGGRRQRNQIRRSLKSMNKILRKTMYTLRRIKSLIMQHLQMARDYHMNVPVSL